MKSSHGAFSSQVKVACSVMVLLSTPGTPEPKWQKKEAVMGEASICGQEAGHGMS